MAGPLAHDAGTYVPTNANIDNGGQISLGVRFTVDSAMSLGGITFYAPGTNTGTYSFAFYTSTTDDDPNGSGTGTLISSSSIASTSITPGAWNDLPLPLDAVTGVIYTARVHTSSGRFVNTPNAFNATQIAGNGVTLLAAGANPVPPGLGSMLNGVFLDGANGYPNTAFNVADYGIDVWAAAAPDAVTGALAATTTAPTAVVAGVEAFAGVFAAAPPLPTATLAGVEALSGALSAVPPLPVSVLAGLVAVPVTAVLSAVTAAPSAAFTGYTPVVERPASFEPLLDMVRNARRNADVRVRATACPKCGDPLEAARGVLHCPWDGSVY